MAGTTPNLGLYLAGGGSTGTWTPDEVADVDAAVNQNLVDIDTWAGLVGQPTVNRSINYYGPAASIGSVSPPPKDGDTYQESDGHKILWKRVGGVWVMNVNGAYLIRPTSVGGATISSDGTIEATGAAAININGIFSSRFRDVEIFWSLNRTVSGTPIQMRMRNAGADDAAANYHWRRAGTAGDGYAEGTVGPVNSFDFSVTGYVQQKGHIRLQGADLADITRIYSGEFFDTNGVSFSQTHTFVGEHRVTSPRDGCSLFVGSGTISGRILVIGHPFGLPGTPM